MVPGPRVELGTPASSGQRSTDELPGHRAFREYQEKQGIGNVNSTETKLLIPLYQTLDT